MPAKALRRAEQLGRAAREREASAAQELLRAILSVAAHQLRLVVEQTRRRRRAGHGQIADALRLGRKVRPPRRERIEIRLLRRRFVAGEQRQRQSAQAERAGAEEVATGDVEQVLGMEVHWHYL